MGKRKSLVAVERVERTILLIRSQKVILDADLAKLYSVTTKVTAQSLGNFSSYGNGHESY